eukprot:CAMPEP_0174747412 /NCGR_PEP_ID=MMETSP1094-20130205/91145_1 /TAXON_ID=156173 /ORGANISM="Chrysochromulina brevifilum, Strain UTEX LB 985" /LENGTH=30 /DNA_ID= /DNA_START= /DNA_END= /DNA_ORIENTATION=
MARVMPIRAEVVLVEEGRSPSATSSDAPPT